ncbi:FAD binding domain-containing protein [Scheffersomyces coipomensis]|uniref:FAD binding domain-containing protein n=1 Tax=Scheffersomyces coipomensis TaxID=1788519 RepID=UPI00315C6A89
MPPSPQVAGVPTTVVIGSGLAGLSTCLNLIEQGFKVILLEKTDKIGGNSIKASSGINGILTKFQPPGDSIESFKEDTLKSGKYLNNLELVDLLVENSKSAVEKLVYNYNIDLSKITQLGGHSYARTHRPASKLPPGFAIISNLKNQIESEKYSNLIQIIKNAKFNKFITDNSKSEVKGIEYVQDDIAHELLVDNIVLATGGFSADFNEANPKESLINQFRPDLIKFPSTNGQQTTGDGQKIAVRDLNANLIDMDKIQIHPTGFVNIKSINDKWKFLCGELLRGIGGILVNPNTGKRFVNELDTRDIVSNAIIKECEIGSSSSHKLDHEQSIAIIVINKADAEAAIDHIQFYKSQGLLTLGNYNQLLELIHEFSPDLKFELTDFINEFNQYNQFISTKLDSKFNRGHFGAGQFNPEDQVYFGLVTPVLHFTMGGIAINSQGNIINQNQKVIPNVYAAGEVSGGVHGGNRLAGSSLLECVVFGKVVSESIIEKSPFKPLE